ncbi:MAG: formimidoylglutamate deiminase [Planctomycetota bacterium]|nr:formimidoylglutamate deiminase [Planctomycetota bacterium]
MSPLDSIRAELTWVDGSLQRGLEIGIDAEGRVESVEPTTKPPTHDRVALLPGFVNSHSHAFQRALRGRGERFERPEEDFWSWREAMYELVQEMDRDSMNRIARQAFSEMRRAGMTTVGEFHYLHHDQPGDWAFDEVMLQAAADVGIRIVLLQAYYVTGAIGEPLGAAQQRFDGQELDAYWSNMDRLQARVDGRAQKLGVVAHSIRAVPPDQLAMLHEESRRRGLVFHMHVEEQPAEIKACQEAYGCTPTGLLLEHLQLDDHFTAVHDTHTDPGDMARYLATGARVCLCPLTEANLGDGLADVPGILDAAGKICLGSDSNARISMIEEMRLVEYGQRLRLQRRGSCRDVDGRIDRVLLDMATIHGAEALGVPAGRIAPGCEADFVMINLDAPTLAGCDEDNLAASIILGAAEECIAGTMVGGVA